MGVGWSPESDGEGSFILHKLLNGYTKEHPVVPLRVLTQKLRFHGLLRSTCVYEILYLPEVETGTGRRNSEMR